MVLHRVPLQRGRYNAMPLQRKSLDRLAVGGALGLLLFQLQPAQQ